MPVDATVELTLFIEQSVSSIDNSVCLPSRSPFLSLLNVRFNQPHKAGILSHFGEFAKTVWSAEGGKPFKTLPGQLDRA